MGTGNFTLYRNTHRKAGFLFAVVLLCAVGLAMLINQVDNTQRCAIPPQTLGRFVVTPHALHFSAAGSGEVLLAKRTGVRHCG